MRRELIAPERVATIGVAVDGPERLRASMNAGLPEARKRARVMLGLPQDAAVVGAVGRLTYQKAPEDFIAAMREIGRPGVIGIWIGGGELAVQRACQTRNDFVLHVEEIGQGLVEPLGPEMIAGLGVDELHIDAHSVSAALDAALEDIADV